MGKWFIILLVTLIWVPQAIASDGGIVGQNTFFQCYAMYGNYLDSTIEEVNVTVSYPNGSEYANLTTTKVKDGKFVFNYTPAIAGNWQQLCRYYNDTTFVGEVPQSSHIINENESVSNSMIIATIIGLAIFAIILIYSSTITENQYFKLILYVWGVLMSLSVPFALQYFLFQSGDYSAIQPWVDWIFYSSVSVIGVGFTVYGYIIIRDILFKSGRGDKS